MTNNKTGLLAFWKDYDRKQMLRAVQIADELGYDSFWLAEAWGYAAFPLLAEIAAHTKNIRIGTAIVNVFSRSPALIAQNAATLQEISEGRFVLGIGSSGVRVIEGFHAREFKKPLTQIRDVIRITKTLLAGKRLTEADAKLADYRPFELEVPSTPWEIPIYVAALKQKSITSIGEMADGWIPTFWPYRNLADGQAWIAEGAAKSGRDPKEITTAPFTTVIPGGAEIAEKRSKERIAMYIGGMGDYYKDLLSNFGFAEDCKKIEALWADKATRAQAYDAVPDAMMEALSITGDPKDCVQELNRRREFGLDLPILSIPTQVDWEIAERFIRGLAPE